MSERRPRLPNLFGGYGKRVVPRQKPDLSRFQIRCLLEEIDIKNGGILLRQGDLEVKEREISLSIFSDYKPK